MTYALFVNSANSLSFNPEYDFRHETRKIENKHRVRSGERYTYQWANYERFRFSLNYVSSSDAAIINSWWQSDAELLFMDEATTEVFSVQLVNKRRPMNSFIKPYNDQLKGKLELETY